MSPIERLQRKNGIIGVGIVETIFFDRLILAGDAFRPLR